jgi:hypothetical protein
MAIGEGEEGREPREEGAEGEEEGMLLHSTKCSILTNYQIDRAARQQEEGSA